MLKHARRKRTLCLLLLLGLLLACGQRQPETGEAPSAQPTEILLPAATGTPIVVVAMSVPPTKVPSVVTPDPTPVPTQTPTPTETPAPTEDPTPTPEPLAFLSSADFPLPDLSTQIQKGRPFWVNGVVSAPAALSVVRAQILDSKGKVAAEGVKTFSPEENVQSYELLDLTFSKDVDCVAEALKFQTLPVGKYTLRILAAQAGAEEQLLAESQFQVTNETWLQLQPNNLRGNYTTALAFFGSPERFMFRYRIQSGSTKITIDPEWVSQYVGEATCLNGRKWVCHVDAVPYFEQACRYMENTYIHIAGKTFDTGALKLSSLVGKMDGTMIRRFTNSNEFLSHHSFGTAVDINAHYASQKDILANREKIYNEVTNNLTYNGIVTVGGKACYDFTYTGTARREIRNVPEPLMNYFLYELAFFRAGFSWGVYYPHTSDAMHFTLSELSPSLFTDGPYAMRKVFTYVEDGAEGTPEP